MIDWLRDSRFYVQLETKQVISKILFPANLLALCKRKKNANKKSNTKNYVASKAPVFWCYFFENSVQPITGTMRGMSRGTIVYS